MKIFPVFIAFCSCSSKDMSLQEPAESLVPMSIQVGSAPKTMLDDPNVLWLADDRISVFDGEGNRCFSNSSGQGSSAIFVGEAAKASKYRLLYPYQSAASLNGSTINLTIPTVQQIKKGSFGNECNVAIGEYSNDDDAVTMYNVCSLAELELNSGAYNVTSIRFSSLSNEKISGAASAVLSPGSVSVEMSSGAASYAELSSEYPMTAGKYYIDLAPGQVSGLNVLFTFSDGKTSQVQLSGPFNFASNKIVNLGSIVVPAPTDFVEEADDKSSDPVSAYVSQGISFPALVTAGHPRLFMDKDDFDALRDRVVTSASQTDFYYDIHTKIMNNAIHYRDNSSTPTYTLVNDKLLEQSRLALMRLFHFSYAYKMTGDMSYLTAAKSDLTAVCNFQNWNSSKHFLDCSEMALAVAIAYDWLYYELSLQERTAAHTALKNFDLSPFATYTPTLTTNWNQVCNGGALAAAVVLYEKDKAICASTIDKAITSNLSAIDKMYNPNGNGLEGYGYWEYAATFEAVIINALDAVFNSNCGLSDVAGFKKTPSWKLFMDGVTGPFNFSDDASESHSITPVMIWFAARYDKPEFTTVEKYLMQNVERVGHRCMPLMICGMQHYGYVDAQASYPSEKMWYATDDNSPIVMVRDGWKFAYSDKYFGFKGSGAYNNHAHMDAGSFVYDAFGKRWASDIPMGAYSAYSECSQLFDMYQSSLRWDILCQNNYFHNTLSFTKGAEKAKSGKVHYTDQIIGSLGTFTQLYDSDADGYGAKMDLTPYYSDFVSQVCRTVKLKGNDLYVIDQISSYPSYSAPFEWRMITKTDVEVGNEYITLTKSSTKLYIKTTVTSGTSTDFTYGTESVARPSDWTARSWDSAQNYSKYKVVKYSAKVPANTTTVFTTVLSPTKPE